jgi:hypothetical protein
MEKFYQVQKLSLCLLNSLVFDNDQKIEDGSQEESLLTVLFSPSSH